MAHFQRGGAAMRGSQSSHRPNSQSNSQYNQQRNQSRSPSPMTHSLNQPSSNQSARRSFEALQSELSNQSAMLGDLTLQISAEKNKFLLLQKNLGELRFSVEQAQKNNQAMNAKVETAQKTMQDQPNNQPEDNESARQFQQILERERKQAHRLDEAKEQLERARAKFETLQARSLEARCELAAKRHEVQHMKVNFTRVRQDQELILFDREKWMNEQESRPPSQAADLIQAERNQQRVYKFESLLAQSRLQYLSEELESVKERYARALASPEGANELASELEVGAEMLGEFLDGQFEDADAFIEQCKLLSQVINEQICFECGVPVPDDLSEPASTSMLSPTSSRSNLMSELTDPDGGSMMGNDYEDDFHFSLKQG